ncbi:hypothetical protein PVE_P0219 (plasmid) [Pseudomonas veronii 1YdBTEX2]|uniref:Uncharacterized protein n=2 Tax=Pseudomonas veronii TaxID=76761 RepID=A0A7Y1AAY9_PSEVE|nr:MULTISPECIES: hypothetical protein [Pseudomonas]MBI6557255.1 hypothetical protein [Pseudomonas veronii]MBI6653976.1 hypothetical protein [Pseudomonas veronii]NMY12420.1 hypothetical protein [Pseudomonas veronii]SBW85259.1 hypothetical protein PVE_P0219 [Pseudomonas veronii 1YdBTEX2]
MNDSTFGSEFVTAAKQAPRLFFAPLLGAISAVKSEFQRIQHGARRNIEQIQTK